MGDSPVRIVWNEGTLGAWDALLGRVPRLPLTQSFAYAQAMAKTNGYLPRLGVIERDGQALGIVQVLERRTLKIAVQRQIHRGPVWFDGPPPDGELRAVLSLLRQACPNTFFNRLHFLPELPDGDAFRAAMDAAGFRRIGPGYRTVWLDLTRDEGALRAAFSPTWRQRLKAAEKTDLTLDADWKAMNLPWLMEREAEQAQAKGFHPLSGRLAVRLRNALVGQGGALTVTAKSGEEPVAAGYFLVHGHTATYQVGWSGERGRKTHAMRLVLWRAIQALKERGASALDLGGINPDKASGVTEFKLAMGGEAVETVGLYR